MLHERIPQSSMGAMALEHLVLAQGESPRNRSRRCMCGYSEDFSAQGWQALPGQR